MGGRAGAGGVIISMKRGFLKSSLNPLHQVPFLDNLCTPDEQDNHGNQDQRIDPWRVDRVPVQRRMEQVDEIGERGEGGEEEKRAGQLAERDEDPGDEDEREADEA